MTAINREYKYQGYTKEFDQKGYDKLGYQERHNNDFNESDFLYDFRERPEYELTPGHKKTAVTVLNFLNKHSNYGTYCEKAKKDLKEAATFFDLELGTVNMIYFGLRYMENRGYYKQIRERQNAYLHALSEMIWLVRQIIMGDRQQSIKVRL